MVYYYTGVSVRVPARNRIHSRWFKREDFNKRHTFRGVEAGIKWEWMKDEQVLPSGAESRNLFHTPGWGTEGRKYVTGTQWALELWRERAAVIVSGYSCHHRYGMKAEWVGKKQPSFYPANHLLLVLLLANTTQKAASKRFQEMWSAGTNSWASKQNRGRKEGSEKWKISRTVGFWITKELALLMAKELDYYQGIMLFTLHEKVARSSIFCSTWDKDFKMIIDRSFSCFAKISQIYRKLPFSKDFFQTVSHLTLTYILRVRHYLIYFTGEETGTQSIKWLPQHPKSELAASKCIKMQT